MFCNWVLTAAGLDTGDRGIHRDGSLLLHIYHYRGRLYYNRLFNRTSRNIRNILVQFIPSNVP